MRDESPTREWARANERAIMARVAVVQAQISARLDRDNDDELAEAQEQLAVAEDELTGTSTLDQLVEWFGLSTFERDILVLTAGMELSGSFAEFIAKLPQTSTGAVRPTFSLALFALPDSHWSALSPDAPLRNWSLIVPGPSERLVHAPLRIDERILHFLTNTATRDGRLAELLRPVPTPRGALPASHAAIVRQLVATWTDSGDQWPVLQLCGPDRAASRSIAAMVCDQFEMRLDALDASDLPTAPADRHQWLKLWERESILSDSALLIEVSDTASSETVRAIQRTSGAVFVSSHDALSLAPRPSLRIPVPLPTRDEQRALWADALGAVEDADAQIDAVISQFALPADAIAVTGRLARARIVAEEEEEAKTRVDEIDAVAEAMEAMESRTLDNDVAADDIDEPPLATEPGPLWHLCRAQVGARLGDLAQHIESSSEWTDLVLPKSQKAILRTIIAQVQRRAIVYDDWGFASRGARGLGLSTLFAGPSGTGKTMAAEVMAGVLSLDLYRIDLSAVVSKYIGETEKNLRRVFDAAESGGAVLLFDEADALFGRRSEVKDSHDRFANIEVSYLLQRMEAYRGLAILTTNLKEALDSAFLRRLRFVVQFPYPEAPQRASIWEKTIPRDLPVLNLDYKKLSKLNVTGGSIRNIALNAAFLAADEGEPVQMRHMRVAAESEAAKLERPLLETEVAAWV